MSKPIQETHVLVLKAEDAGARADTTASNRRYKHPRIGMETRALGRLAEDHVRVETLYVGICGTDLHLLQSDPQSGFVRTSAAAEIPPEGRVIGHEGVGRLLEVGSNVRSLAPGAIVAIASIIACMRCHVCQRGAFNQCCNALLLGMQKDGLFGTIVDVPASIAYNISHMVKTEDDLRAAACLEPAGVALLACESARVSPGDSVAIFGGGPIGVYCAMLCKRVLGAAHVALIEPMEFRRRSARPWCDRTYDTEAYLTEEQTPIDVVIEASGDLSNVSHVFRRVGPNGRVMLLGRRGMALSLDAVDHMITQAISIAGSRGHLGVPFAKTLALYQSGLLPLAGVVSAELDSLDALLEALQNTKDFNRTHCKVLARLRRFEAAPRRPQPDAASAFT